MIKTNMVLTLLPTYNQVLQEVYGDGVIGGQVRLAVDREEAEALALRGELGLELLRRHAHSLWNLLVG